MADLGLQVRPDLTQRRRASGTVLITSSGSPSSSSSLSASMMRARLSDNSGSGGGNKPGILPEPSYLNVSQRSTSSSPRVASRRPSDIHGPTAFVDDDDDIDEQSLVKHLHLTKLTRSASSSNPALRDVNQIPTPLARPQTGRSVSSSVGGSVVGNSTSTTSPLTTPGDGPMHDPLAMAVAPKGKLSANATSASALEMSRPFDEGTADQQSFALGQATDGRRAAKENMQGRHGTAAEHDSLEHPWKAQRPPSVPSRSWAANTITNNVADHQSTAALTDPWSRDDGEADRKGGAGVVETAHLTESRGNSSSDNSDKVAHSAAGEQAHPIPFSAAPSAPLLSKDVQQITTQPPLSTKHSGGGGDTDGAGATVIRSDGYLRSSSSSSLAEDAGAPSQRRTAPSSSLAHSPADQRSEEQYESMTYPLVPGEATASGSFEGMASSSIEGQQQQGQQQERHRSSTSNDNVAGAASISPSTAADSPQFVAQGQDMFGHVHIPPQVLQQQQHQQQQLYGSSFGPYPSSSATRSPMTTIQPIEAGVTSSYDVFRAANMADPYASTYSMPLHQTALPPGSTPQSPAFGPHLTAQPGLPSDSSLYMYTTANVMPASSFGRPPSAMMPSSVMSGQAAVHAAAAQNAATPMMMHGVPASIVPQTSMMMTTPPMDRHSRRDSHLSQGALPHSVPPQFMQNTWGSMTLPNTLGTAAGAGQGFVHGHSPSWPAAGDLRSVMGGAGVNPAAHRRMISGPFQGAYVHQQPGSPPNFVRQHGMGGGTRSPHSRTPSTLSFSSSYGRLPMGAEAVQYRSPLLEEFRSRHNRGKRFELQDIRGAVVEFSSDQHGSRFTQEKLTTATDEELQMVFDEINPHARTLMTDVFGNYVVQKLIEHGTPEMRSELCKQIYGHVLTLSLSTYGCRVVQRALDFVEMHEKMAIAVELKDYILQCVRDQNANHVVQKILERVSPTTQVDFIPAAFVNNTYMLSSHCYSCRVLQRIFEHCEEEQKRPLMEELLMHASELMHDQYGNYVIQWILRNADRADKDRVINLAKGNILHLSRHKFASNVVEQIIAASSQEDRYAFTEEIMEIVNSDEVGAAPPGAAMTAPAYGTSSPSEAVSAAELMMRDQFGNYVLQRFLEHAEGAQKQRLVVSIKRALTSMKRFTTGAYTKHLAAIERLLEANVARSNAGTMTNPSSNVQSDMSTASHPH